LEFHGWLNTTQAANISYDFDVIVSILSLRKFNCAHKYRSQMAPWFSIPSYIQI
jgi:hypothetical protein